MAGQRGLITRASPLLPQSAQAGSPMPAVLDHELALQTQTLAHHERRTVKHYYWWHSIGAPAVDTATVNSDVLLDAGLINTNEIEIPWLAHPDGVRINAVAYVAVASFDLTFQLSMETKTLLSSVTTTQGPRVSVRPIMPMPRGVWSRRLNLGALSRLRYHEWKLGLVPLTVEPDYPATRTLPLAIRFKGYWSALTDPTNLSVKRAAAIMAIKIWDQVDPPNPES